MAALSSSLGLDTSVNFAIGWWGELRKVAHKNLRLRRAASGPILATEPCEQLSSKLDFGWVSHQWRAFWGAYYPLKTRMSLKKIGNPVPMLVRTTSSRRAQIRPTSEQIGKQLGWDLVEGDWVKPHGSGKVSDFIITFKSSENNVDRHSSVEVKLGNKNDGFIVLREIKGNESLLKFPRNAPKDGYLQKIITYSISWEEDNITVLPTPMPVGYLLRLRTTMDDENHVKSALYGKIAPMCQRSCQEAMKNV